MRVLALAVALVAALVVPAYAQTGGEAAATGSLNALLYVGQPGADGKVIAETQLSAKATAEMAEANHVDLRTGSRGFVFAVARIAAVDQAVGETTVTVNGAARTLFSVAAELQTALAGGGIVLFTNGQGQTGVIVGAVPADQAQGNLSVTASGATHVTVIIGPAEETFALASAGATMASVMVVESGGESGAEAQSKSLVEVIASIRARIGE